MRFGEKKTVVHLDETDGLTLVTGKNGHGKSTIFDALSYVLTNKPLRKTAVGKMVNNVNSKGLLVSLDILKDDKLIKIIRGQKPTICKLYIKPVDSDEKIEQEKYDYTRDSVNETSKDITKLLGFDSDLFRCMVINSTRTPTFFQSDSSTQKNIMENLFGFDILTEKAILIKAKKEQYRFELEKKKSVLEERVASVNRTKARISSLEEKVTAWNIKHDEAVYSAKTNIERLVAKDPESAIEKFTGLQEYIKELADVEGSIKEIKTEISYKEREISRLSNEQKSLHDELVDIEILIQNKNDLSYNEDILKAISDCETELSELKLEVSRYKTELKNNEKQLSDIEDDNCPTCGQLWPDIETRQNKKETLIIKRDEINESLNTLNTAVISSNEDITELKNSLKKTKYNSTSEIDRIEQRNNSNLSLIDKNNELSKTISKAVDELNIDLKAYYDAKDIIDVAIEEQKPAQYEDISIAIRDKELIASLRRELAKLDEEQNPHISVLEELRADIPDEISGEREIKDIESLIEHHQYLERLLTRKDSPIRRRVTMKYLPILNNRMNSFLSRLNLPYTVEFNDELLPEVFDFDSEIDPGALSGGEEERLVMALNWAFRECWEEIHGRRLSFVAIDERLDSGLDGEGAEASMEILREMSLEKGRNVWVITHRNEFDDYAQNKIVISRKGKFSEINYYTIS